jgi:hypothetical protein
VNRNTFLPTEKSGELRLSIGSFRPEVDGVLNDSGPLSTSLMFRREQFVGDGAGNDRVDLITFGRTHCDQLLDQCLNGSEMSKGWLLINRVMPSMISCSQWRGTREVSDVRLGSIASF